jgi:adenylate cyclase
LGIPLCLFVVKKFFPGPLGPFLARAAAVLVREATAFVSSEQEKQFIRRAFSTYVSGDVVKELIADPSRLQLGGTERHMTALFTGEQNLSPAPLLTRIGINIGSMVAGNMGTENKMNYTIMGHMVNVAARLE